ARALTAWVNRNGAVEKNVWLQGLLERKHYNVAVVAMAAKTSRIMWSMLTRNTEYQPRQPA
ncbi:IS110 family transposase, partial [Citrobacter sp. Awk 4]|nr:IS110 family transposase [Citrobacter sp. Awk 4]